jgi:hypothetical protein
MRHKFAYDYTTPRNLLRFGTPHPQALVAHDSNFG